MSTSIICIKYSLEVMSASTSTSTISAFSAAHQLHPDRSKVNKIYERVVQRLH